MADEIRADSAYQAADREWSEYQLKLKGYREKFAMRTNVLRDRGTLNDSTLLEHINVEQFIDILNRLEQLEALTAVLRSEE